MIHMRSSQLIQTCGVGLALVVLGGCAAIVGSQGQPGSSPQSSSSANAASARPKAHRPAVPAVADAGQVRNTGPAETDGAPTIYLTFDDGPDPGGTDLVLDELSKTHTPATFFVLGQFMQTAAERDLIKREVSEGFSVAAHGFTHPDMKKWSEIQVLAEIRRIQQRIVALTGMQATCFRPPYGSLTPLVRQAAARENVVLQLWDVDTLDWQHPDPDYIYSTIMKQIKPGSVILMHDGRGHGKVAAEVVRRVVAAATKQGFRFGSFCPLGPT